MTVLVHNNERLQITRIENYLIFSLLGKETEPGQKNLLFRRQRFLVSDIPQLQELLRHLLISQHKSNFFVGAKNFSVGWAHLIGGDEEDIVIQSEFSRRSSPERQGQIISRNLAEQIVNWNEELTKEEKPEDCITLRTSLFASRYNLKT
jgi:hypothetical protein